MDRNTNVETKEPPPSSYPTPSTSSVLTLTTTTMTATMSITNLTTMITTMMSTRSPTLYQMFSLYQKVDKGESLFNNQEAKNSPKSEYVYSPVDSNHSSSSGVSSDPRYIIANSSANNMNNNSNSPPHETNASLASHVKVIQGCDGRAAEVTKAHDLEETVSGDDTICTDNNVEENIIVVKTKPDDDYNEEYFHGLYSAKNYDGNEKYEQQDGRKVIASVQFPMASSTSKHRRKQSCPSKTLKLSDSRTQVAGDDTNSSNEVNVTNWTTKKIRAKSPAVIVNPAYVWPNLQGSFQTIIFQTKNPGGTTSELRPQAMQIGEWANNQGQSNALTDPSDRMGMLLFGATHIQKLSAKSDDGQSPGTPKGATVVRGKLVSSEEKRKIYQTQATIKGYSDGHQVQHEVKDINTSPNIHRKPTARESSVQRMCFNCGTTCSTVWRRLNEHLVCNACGLYYKKYGKIRPPTMRRDTIYTRQRRKQSDNGMDISMNKKKIKIKKTEDIKLEEDCHEVEQPLSLNSTAVQTIIEESVQDEMPLNLVSK